MMNKAMLIRARPDGQFRGPPWQFRGPIPGDKLVGGLFGPVLGVHHEQHVREAGAKVGAVDVVMSGGLGRVDVHTLRAIQLHHRLSRNIGQTCGQFKQSDTIQM